MRNLGETENNMIMWIAASLLIGVLANRVGITIINLIPDSLIRWRWIALGENGLARSLRMVPFVSFIVGGWNLIILTGYDTMKDGGIGIF